MAPTVRRSRSYGQGDSRVVALLIAILSLVGVAALICVLRLLRHHVRRRRRRRRRARHEASLATTAATARALRRAAGADPADSLGVSRLAHVDLAACCGRAGTSLAQVDEACPLFRLSAQGKDPGECPVCLDKLELGQRARRLPCGHLFHDPCAVLWLVKSNHCPVCRCPPVQRGAGARCVEGARAREDGGLRLFSGIGAAQAHDVAARHVGIVSVSRLRGAGLEGRPV